MEIVVRATVIYWFLFLVVRGAGKRSLAELTPLDMLIIVILGDIVQQGVTQEDMSVTGAIMAVLTFVAWTLVADWLERRSKTARSILAGEPVIILRKGRIDVERLRDEKLTEDDLIAAAREQGFARLSEISLGVLEDDGAFSFLPVRDGRS
ncbi:MAG TPA: YetF domain-containing protein [Acidimicrobiia bacterium]|nr:YetF domain-containing protein [Acidimicrobiia bacterium]